MAKVMASTYRITALFAFLLVGATLTDACGCTGPGSCAIDGTRTNGQHRCGETSVCDCCPVCNTCNQLLSGCSQSGMLTDVHFAPLIPRTYLLNQPIQPSAVQSDSFPGNFSDFFIAVCLDRQLPEGLTLSQNPAADDNRFILSGTPTETMPATVYHYIVKGLANYLARGTFTLTVIPQCGAPLRT